MGFGSRGVNVKVEVPFVIEVEGKDLEDALNNASDLGDKIESVFETPATALIGRDHNLHDRMGIRWPSG